MWAEVSEELDEQKRASLHTAITEEAMTWARKLQLEMSSGRTGHIDYTLRVNTLIALFRREEKDLTYVEWHRASRVTKKRRLFDVNFTIWPENQGWWERQRGLISEREGRRPVRENRILNSLFVEGVPLLLGGGA